MRRRDFLSFCGLSVAGFTLDPSRLLWTPGIPHFEATDGGFLVPVKYQRAIFKTFVGRDMESLEVGSNVILSHNAGGGLDPYQTEQTTLLSLEDLGKHAEPSFGGEVYPSHELGHGARTIPIVMEDLNFRKYFQTGKRPV